MKADGSLVQEGDIIRNMKFGQTLRRIAEDPFTFYNGTLAQDIVDDITDRGLAVCLFMLATSILYKYLKYLQK